MPYSIELHFDEQSNNNFKNIIDILASEGVRSLTIEQNIPPHLTLCVYDTLNITKTQSNINLASQKYHIFKLKLTGIGLFPSTEPPLFLIPKITINLLKIQRYMCNLFEPYQKTQWKYYSSENWVPHCSIAFNLPRNSIPNAISIVLKSFQPSL
ncbi:MAG: 2'-5' RNA ligase family protein [Candidatus Hodarchaeales archaeon]|jgi:2'-5' RNA ligase